VAGHRGLLGSAVVRKLQKEGFNNLLLKTSRELDLRNQAETFKFFEEYKPQYVFLCAAKVGGIQANMDSPATFLYENMMINANVMEAARKVEVKKLLFVASSCIYPRISKIPIKESALLKGELEPTNEGYAIAKIAGIKLCEFYRKEYGCNFISAIPPNLFGINDHYDLRSSHLLPALILKVHLLKKENATILNVWGTGTPRREFMLSDDCADALLFLMNNYVEKSPINCGTGIDHSVVELAYATAKVLGVNITITHDLSKADGMPKKLIDSSRINDLGWKPNYSLEEGIQIAYEDFLTKHSNL